MILNGPRVETVTERNTVFDLQEFEEATHKSCVGPWFQHSGLIKDPGVRRDPGHSFPLGLGTTLKGTKPSYKSWPLGCNLHKILPTEICLIESLQSQILEESHPLFPQQAFPQPPRHSLMSASIRSGRIRTRRLVGVRAAVSPLVHLFAGWLNMKNIYIYIFLY